MYILYLLIYSFIYLIIYKKTSSNKQSELQNMKHKDVPSYIIQNITIHYKIR